MLTVQLISLAHIDTPHRQQSGTPHAFCASELSKVWNLSLSAAQSAPQSQLLICRYVMVAWFCCLVGADGRGVTLPPSGLSASVCFLKSVSYIVFDPTFPHFLHHLVEKNAASSGESCITCRVSFQSGEISVCDKIKKRFLSVSPETSHHFLSET